MGDSLDHLSVLLLGPEDALGSSGGPSDHMVSAFAVRGCPFNYFGCVFKGREHHFLIQMIIWMPLLRHTVSECFLDWVWIAF